jgi:YihY family inner membrane protein
MRVLLRRTFATTRRALQVFSEARGFQHAAAISYFAVLSLLPFLILLVATFGFVATFLGSRSGSEESLLEMIARALQDLAPFLVDQVTARLRSVIQARDALGLVGVVVLLVTASLVFEAIETAAREILRAPRTRHVLLARALFLALFAGVSLLVAIAGVLLALVRSWLAVSDDASLVTLVARYRFLDWAVSVGLLASLFVGIVAYVSREHRARWPLAGGALVFLALFALSRFAFGVYVERFARFDLVYGSLATIVIGLVWIYYVALVFLLAVAVVRVLGEETSARAEEVGADPHEGGPLGDGDLEV